MNREQIGAQGSHRVSNQRLGSPYSSGEGKSTDETFNIQNPIAIGSPFTIPTVIHLIAHPTNPNLISEAEIRDGLDFINGVFSGTRACFGDLLSTDVGIQFCLAQRDINAQPSSGILSYTSELSQLDACTQEAALKDWVQAGYVYPSTDYLNI